LAASVQCFTDVPAADTNSVAATNAILVFHLGDAAATNGCEITVKRTYGAVNSCNVTSTCDQVITVLDTIPPALTGSSNQLIECGGAWDFIAPTATDLCVGTNVTVTALGASTNNLCGLTITATQTWVGTDASSNASYFSQTVTIIDTTAPSVLLPTNRVVECGDAWNFDLPPASDVCSTGLVVSAVTVTNPIVGQTFSATRTWTFTDDCGNATNVSQTVAVLDTVPPQIFCTNDIVVECAGPAGNAIAYNPIATDACDTNINAVTSPVSGSLFTLGTNLVVSVATDDSGNTNFCTFNIIVVDTTPPLISCPAPVIAAETPRDSGSAVVTFSNAVVSDICDAALSPVATPASGSTFLNGITPVTWTVTDGSGNTNFCTFNVRVIPYRLVVSTTLDSGPGSLKQALLDANDAPGENYIYFNLPGTGPHLIQPLAALPAITSPVIIDGWSESGTNQPPVVSIDGVNTSNTADGLVIQSGSSTVRGLAIVNFANGIVLGSGTNTIQGNYIGLALDGTNAAPNANNGVLLTTGASRNMIGGLAAGAANVIAFNGGNGVSLGVAAGGRNTISGNSIHSNGGLGIDLSGDGVTANDLDDTDGGPNTLANFPILSDARSSFGVTEIDGSLNAVPGTYRIEFFLNPVADVSLHGEGRVFIGSTVVSVNGSGTENFSASLVLTALYTDFISATATDLQGNTSEFSPVVQVRTPPMIELQPQSTNSMPGDPVTFCAQATGTPPIYYQWRLNGVNIPGGTNACYTIPSAELGDGGTYTVIIRNALNAFASFPASLILGGANILTPGVGDNFANAVDISSYEFGTNGVLAGNNAFATFEAFEPAHAGKFGGRSVWYKWCTPSGGKGIATFRTTGSTFDTLIGVYRGTSVSNLIEVASSEDDGRGYSSEVRFNAFYNSSTDFCYYIAVDAYDRIGGDFVLAWNQKKTAHMLPVILLQPSSITVPPGAAVTFTNFSVPECAQGHLDCNHDHWQVNNNQKEKLTYQWYLDGYPIAGATNRSYTIASVDTSHLGDYRVRVFTPWEFLDSRRATLQINFNGEGTQPVQAVDKFFDLFFTDPIFLGIAPENQNRGDAGLTTTAAGTVVRGYTGTQIFNTAGSATEPGEVICGVTGGSSEWITFVPEQTGTLFLNTIGSSYDTVMAVFRRNPTNAAALQLLACDNNSGTDGLDSAVSLAVEGGKTNYVLVDGVNGATGILYLNYSLATTTIIKLAGRTAEGANIVQVNGRPGINFAIQASTNFSNWASIVTTNAPTGVFNYTDNGSISLPRRYYRALILP
jgi:hypothetical protein